MKHVVNLSPTEDDIWNIRRKLKEYNAKHFEIDDEYRFTISYELSSKAFLFKVWL